MKIQVWVLRWSNCGNGNDDDGYVIGVFSSEEAAEKESRVLSFHRQQSYNISDWGDYDVEGPFDLELTIGLPPVPKG